MIEVTLAIGILAMGATAVLTLFPLGIDRNKASIGETYSTEAATSMLSYIESTTNIDNGTWKQFFGEPGVEPFFPTDKQAVVDTSRLDNGFVFVGSEISANLYDVDDDGMTKANGVYGLKVQTGDVTDFTGEALLWQTKLGDVQISDADIFIDTDIAVRVNLEISWPVTMQYRFRKKNYYTLDLFNYNN